MKELLTKLASVKKEIGTLSKNASNPFFKSKYLDLNEILTHLEPLLDKYDLILLQPVFGNQVCTEIHDTATGQSVKSFINVPELTDPQKTGSAITYYRRYSLQSLLALQAEDDDANAASGKKMDTQQNGAPKPETAKDPEKWLDVMDKEKNFTREWLNVLYGIKTGKINSVSDVRKVYKVSKQVAEKIEEQLHNLEKVPA